MLLFVVQAIQQGDEEACASLVRGSRTSLVHAISATSSESTASINPAVVKLQMLTMLAEAWDLQWHKQLSVLPGSAEPAAALRWLACFYRIWHYHEQSMML